MPRAFWTITAARAAAGGGWEPSIPSSVGGVTFITPLDLYILLPHATDPNGQHRHLLLGGFAFPSQATTYNHSHAIVAGAGGYYQAYHVGGGTAHTHVDNQRPEFFMSWVSCTDAAFTTLTSAPHNLRVLAEAPVAGDSPGDLAETLWSAGDRTFWNNLFINNAGIQLPAEIDRGKRLVLWLLGSLQARRPPSDRAIRG